MYIRVPEELEELAKIFKKKKIKLYIVGGYLRNQILGIPDKYNIDIDVCSSATPEEVFDILKNSEFMVSYMNKTIGVVEISRKLRVEHATFRKETYSTAGAHLPDKIEFIKDINEDAKRRDFRCNALYYDISEQELIDPFDGFSDIKNKIIRTTLDPKITFNDDAERIIRMVRFACTLGFNIDKETFKEAKNNVDKLKYISNTRKREEFSRIVLADTAFDYIYNVKNAHARGIAILCDLNAIKYILPALETIKQSNIKIKSKSLFEHVLNIFAFSAPEVRLSALLCYSGKATAYSKYGNYTGFNEFNNTIIENNLGVEGLNFNKKVVERVKKVVFGLNFNNLGLETKNNIKKFIVKNGENIKLILDLKSAIALDKFDRIKQSIIVNKMKNIYYEMLNDNAPLKLEDLDIDGNKIKEIIPELRKDKIGMILNDLLIRAAIKPKLNNENSLSILAYKIANKNKKYWMV